MEFTSKLAKCDRAASPGSIISFAWSANASLCAAYAPFLFLAGCGSSVSAPSDRTVDHFKVVGLLYAQYASSHNMAPPPDQAAFVKFLETEPANWNKLAPSASEFLKSPRTGEPLRIAYGRLPPAPADGSLPWVASDSSPLDGQMMMVNLRGNVRSVPEQESAAYFPAK